MIEQVVVSALQIVAAVAPGLIALVTGSESDEAGIAAFVAAAKALPQRESSGGDATAGAWDADLAARKGRGDPPTLTDRPTLDRRVAIPMGSDVLRHASGEYGPRDGEGES